MQTIVNRTVARIVVLRFWLILWVWIAMLAFTGWPASPARSSQSGWQWHAG
jgi:hypothetical protein